MNVIRLQCDYLKIEKKTIKNFELQSIQSKKDACM